MGRYCGWIGAKSLQPGAENPGNKADAPEGSVKAAEADTAEAAPAESAPGVDLSQEGEEEEGQAEDPLIEESQSKDVDWLSTQSRSHFFLICVAFEIGHLYARHVKLRRDCRLMFQMAAMGLPLEGYGGAKKRINQI